MSEMNRSKPDDTEWDELIADSESIQEALAAIADKYGANVTNNEPRWQDGVYLRHLGDFFGDVMDAFSRFQEKHDVIVVGEDQQVEAVGVNIDGLPDQTVFLAKLLGPTVVSEAVHRFQKDGDKFRCLSHDKGPVEHLYEIDRTSVTEISTWL